VVAKYVEKTMARTKSVRSITVEKLVRNGF